MVIDFSLLLYTILGIYLILAVLVGALGYFSVRLIIRYLKDFFPKLQGRWHLRSQHRQFKATFEPGRG